MKICSRRFSCLVSLISLAAIADVCNSYSFVSSWFGITQHQDIKHKLCSSQGIIPMREVVSTCCVNTISAWHLSPTMMHRTRDSRNSKNFYISGRAPNFVTAVRFRRKKTSHTGMTATPTSYSNFSSTMESSNSNIEICRVTPGDYNVRALADLCCRSFYGEHYWWSSLLNPISAMQRVILFEKVLADLSNRILKHQIEGCGSLHLAIESSTGEAVGIWTDFSDAPIHS